MPAKQQTSILKSYYSYYLLLLLLLLCLLPCTPSWGGWNHRMLFHTSSDLTRWRHSHKGQRLCWQAMQKDRSTCCERNLQTTKGLWGRGRNHASRQATNHNISSEKWRYPSKSTSESRRYPSTSESRLEVTHFWPNPKAVHTISMISCDTGHTNNKLQCFSTANTASFQFHNPWDVSAKISTLHLTTLHMCNFCNQEKTTLHAPANHLGHESKVGL